MEPRQSTFPLSISIQRYDFKASFTQGKHQRLTEMRLSSPLFTHKESYFDSKKGLPKMPIQWKIKAKSIETKNLMTGSEIWALTEPQRSAILAKTTAKGGGFTTFSTLLRKRPLQFLLSPREGRKREQKSILPNLSIRKA